MVRREGSVEGSPSDVEIDVFDPATRFCMPGEGTVSGPLQPCCYMIESKDSLLEALANQTWPVFNCIPHEAAVDVVEFLMISPLCFNIVDLETNVGRYPLSIADKALVSRTQKHFYL